MQSAGSRMSHVAISIIGLLWLNSLVAQVLLVRSGHSVSLLAFAVWTLVYAAISFALWRRVRLAFWCALVLAALHLLPAMLWAARVMPLALMQSMPSWYAASLWIAFALGLALFFSLVYRNRRGHPSLRI